MPEFLKAMEKGSKAEIAKEQNRLCQKCFVILHQYQDRGVSWKAISNEICLLQ